jgi:DSHCT (NUC185) domain
MIGSPLHKDSRLPELYDLYARKRDAQDRIRALKKRIQATHDVLQMEELKSRKRVLRRLGFTTADDIVDMKGRVACEISTGDELLLTELIFNGLFNPLAPEHCAGLLSCFVFTEKVRAPHLEEGSRDRDPMLTFCCLERATNQAEGGTRGSATCHAGDRATHRRSLQRVEVADRRGRIRSVVQSRAHGLSGAMVPGSVILRNMQGKFLLLQHAHRSALVMTRLTSWASPCSSRTSSKAALFAFSGGCKSSFDKWLRLQRSSATLNFSKNSKKHPRCSSGQTLSFLPRHCTSKCTGISFPFPYWVKHYIHDGRYTKDQRQRKRMGDKKTGETEEGQGAILSLV